MVSNLPPISPRITNGVAAMIGVSRGLAACIIAVAFKMSDMLWIRGLNLSHLAVCPTTRDGVGSVAAGRARVAPRAATGVAFAGHFDWREAHCCLVCVQEEVEV